MTSAFQNCSKFENRTYFGKRFMVLGHPTLRPPMGDLLLQPLPGGGGLEAAQFMCVRATQIAKAELRRSAATRLLGIIKDQK